MDELASSLQKLSDDFDSINSPHNSVISGGVTFFNEEKKLGLLPLVCKSGLRFTLSRWLILKDNKTKALGDKISLDALDLLCLLRQLPDIISTQELLLQKYKRENNEAEQPANSQRSFQAPARGGR